MTRIPLSVSNPRPAQNNRLIAALKWFWRFSNFYGEYQSRPPAERRKFVQEYESQAK